MIAQVLFWDIISVPFLVLQAGYCWGFRNDVKIVISLWTRTCAYIGWCGWVNGCGGGDEVGVCVIELAAVALTTAAMRNVLKTYLSK